MTFLKRFMIFTGQQYLHITLIGAAGSSTGTALIHDALSRARADYIAEKLQSKGVDSSCIDKVFAGGIEEYSPN